MKPTTPKTKMRPRNVMFVITSMPVGGAETLLVNMLYRFDRDQIQPSVCCLKQKDVLGEQISGDFPVYSDLIRHKFDAAVIGRLKQLFRKNEIEAVITIGAGDKMFWGRLAARYAGVPVVLSALHSTGWPDGVGTLNRLLTRITTGFIAVADSHGKHLIDYEGFPEEKVFVIPNGIDTEKFRFDSEKRKEWRQQLGIPDTSPTVGIVAALRPEKNHLLFVDAAARISNSIPNAHFIIAGDGPERTAIENRIRFHQLQQSVHMIGSTAEIPAILSTIDLFALTSHNEASPVSILEAMSCQRPVVSSNVGSVKESVRHGQTGFLVPAGDLKETACRWQEILNDKPMAESMGKAARDHVISCASLDSMTLGYTRLIESLCVDPAVKAETQSVLNQSSPLVSKS